MRKLIALYTNEMIKISRKISVIIILGIMIIGVIGFGGLMKLQVSMNPGNNNYLSQNMQFQKEEMDRQLDSFKGRLSEIKQQKASATGADLMNLESEERSIQNQIDKLQYAKTMDIILFSSSYRAQAIEMLFNYKETVNQLNSMPAASLTQEQKKQLEDAGNYISRLEKAIKNKDFKEYISVSNDQINNNTFISTEEKKISLESNELRLKYNLKGEENSFPNSMDSLIWQIESGKRSLLYNIDYTSQTQKPLSSELREKIKNGVAVNVYKIEKGIIGKNSNTGMNPEELAMPGMVGFGSFMLVILVMILAGGSISQEISTGSIKSLIISPTKRWKIFIAKVVSLLTIGIIGALLLYIVAILTNGAFFGFGSGTPYVYAVNGVAKELGFNIYQFAKLFAGFIDIMLYMTFALMLSIVTRNTAASVGISIAVFFGGSIVNSFLPLFAKGEWLKFIPFNNLSFSTRLFPYDTLNQIMDQGSSGMVSVVNNSILFSLCYIAVLIFCMGYTAFDSFNRRDI
ncbi:MAG: hypothetical protein FIA99_07540 [Ruminiclostridium sp.]|nr:hypothetical protein [Ruminiclostridium sp.]